MGMVRYENKTEINMDAITVQNMNGSVEVKNSVTGKKWIESDRSSDNKTAAEVVRPFLPVNNGQKTRVSCFKAKT